MESWRSIEAVRTRDMEIEVLLNGAFLCVQESCVWPRFNTATHRTALRRILKKAIFQCDAIADLEAMAVVEFNTTPTAWNPQSNLQDFSAENRLASINRGWFLDLNASPVDWVGWNGIRRRTRAFQRTYVHSLSDADLHGVLALVRIASESFRGRRWIRSNVRPRPGWAEEEASFREAVLRHGSWFLFAFVRGFFERGKHGRELMRLARMDLDAFERGVDGEPGVQMALMSELARRLDVRDDPKQLVTEALMKVDEMVRGVQTERPVMFAFSNSPYSGGSG